MFQVAQVMQRARELGLMIPAFNVPYLPMVEPLVQAVVDQDAFALLEVARLEWVKFEARSPAAVAEEFARWAKPNYMRLHLDHIPVIDEDQQRVDYLPIIKEALELGYESVMIDGSRLPLAENIRATRQVVELAQAAGAPVEAELGAVLGHESGSLPPYEELFASGRGFTDPDEAQRFARETGCDWLSVAVGNVHGAIAAGLKDQKKVQARLNLDHLERLAAVAQCPLVLHGGSGILAADLAAAARCGISKINVGTEVRQPYEQALRTGASNAQAQQAVYERAIWVLRDWLCLAGTRARLTEAGAAA